MTNGEKYKTAQEREQAFYDFCENKVKGDCGKCTAYGKGEGGRLSCVLIWLDLEAEEEKPLPCPFCGGECKLESGNGNFWYDCICGYSSKITSNGNEVIAAHNRVAKKCREGKV